MSKPWKPPHVSDRARVASVTGRQIFLELLNPLRRVAGGQRSTCKLGMGVVVSRANSCVAMRAFAQIARGTSFSTRTLGALPSMLDDLCPTVLDGRSVRRLPRKSTVFVERKFFDIPKRALELAARSRSHPDVA